MKSLLNLSVVVALAALSLCTGNTRLSAQTFPDKFGVDLDGLGDGSRSKPLIDLAKTLRGWIKIGGTDASPIDDNGWPTTDAATVLFDIRPFGTWAPPADDPANFQPDWSGTYKMSFTGQAQLSFHEEMRPQVQNQKYDSATNLTTADIIIPKGVGLLVVEFSKTKRTGDSAEGSGITNLRVIRPGYAPDTKADFTDEFLRSLKPFTVLRFMDWLATNYGPGFYGDPGHHVLEWKDRHVPTDATQVPYGKKYGVAWEYVIEMAKLTGKDIWINIPVAASDDYIRQLAQMLKQGLPATTNIYIEHSNEVWNFSFPQYIYNKLAAAGEVKQGGSKLNSDGSTDQEVWAHRRHAERLIKIGDIFGEAFGSDGASRIRPVYASWIISAQPHYADVFAWVEKAYGPPKDYFYALAGGTYYTFDGSKPDSSVDDLIRLMRASSDASVKFNLALQRIADHYGIKHCQYEVGSDTGGGSTVNVGNRILANRDPRMQELVEHDARDNWFANGGDLYMYFAHCGAYSRFGCWGLSEDILDLNTPKWKGIYDLTGTPAPPVTK